MSVPPPKQLTSFQRHKTSRDVPPFQKGRWKMIQATPVSTPPPSSRLSNDSRNFNQPPCLFQVVRALLQRGADPSAKDGSGRTATMGAVIAGRAGALRAVSGPSVVHSAVYFPSQSTHRKQNDQANKTRACAFVFKSACLPYVLETTTLYVKGFDV